MRRILITLLIIILVGAGVWYFYIRPKQASGVSPVPNILKPFFPTSTTGTGSFGVAGALPDTGTSGSSGVTVAPIFKQMTADPVAGYTIFSLTDTPVAAPKPVKAKTGAKKTTIPTPAPLPVAPSVAGHYVRYVARNNGYVYEIKDGGTALQISNIFIPNIYEAMFADNNTTAILRFLRGDNETIATYSVPIPPLNADGTRTQNSGTYLPDNISALAVSPNQSQVARIINDNNGAVLSTSNTAGTGIKTLLHSPFLEWLPSWAGSNVYIQTKATSSADGFFYSVDNTARLHRIIGNTPGLTASISPSGAYILYSESTFSGFITKLFNTKTAVTTVISLDILPEKCAWLQNEDLICAGNTSVPNATYPDDWYKGTIHFSDQLYRITTASNLYTTLYDGQGQSFDMTNVQVDEGQQLVYFIDKNSGLLWQFKY